jgi:hypothetical protein
MEKQERHIDRKCQGVLDSEPSELFMGVWCAVQGACDDSNDDFNDFCDRLSKESIPLKEEFDSLNKALSNIPDQGVKKEGLDSLWQLVNLLGYFYLALGFTLGQDYDIQDPKAVEEMELLRARIKEEALFPLIARRK